MYAGALSNGFVFDDEGYVVTNANLHEGFTWRAIRWAFSSVYKSNYRARSGVRPMNELFPLERAAEAYDRMMSGKARFRVVLTTGS